ncbi:MAG: hypothetical protein BYD32DRAFT_421230 [Podila humilis]|nr:MAG: hypothetical protein BYD32DRAFT_421230 [Podila humilis]
MPPLTFLDIIRQTPSFEKLSDEQWRFLCEALDRFDSNPSPEEVIDISKQIGRLSREVDYFFKAAVYGRSMAATLDKLEQDTWDARSQQFDRWGNRREPVTIYQFGEPMIVHRLTPQEDAEYLRTRPIVIAGKPGPSIHLGGIRVKMEPDNEQTRPLSVHPAPTGRQSDGGPRTRSVEQARPVINQSDDRRQIPKVARKFNRKRNWKIKKAIANNNAQGYGHQ